VFFANGLSLIQAVTADENGRIGVTTRVLHISGEWMESTSFFETEGKSQTTAQKSGSSITYQKRYGLAAFLGIDSETDNDGGLTPSEQAELSNYYTYGDGTRVPDAKRSRQAFDAYAENHDGNKPASSKALKEWFDSRK